ncbi:MAG: DNRLRE domain-containing protein [Firmicutes bacterium]|nr:DNRLRE domain-containing protein [Bacillota bacterium]
MFKKKTVSDKQILIVVRLIDASKKFLIFLILFGQLVSLVPQNAFQVSAISYEEQEKIIINEKAYPSTTDSTFSHKDIKLVDEVSELRTDNTKTFRREDGSFVVAVYNDSVHYLENGDYKDINNSLSYDSKSTEYTNKNNAFSFKLPKQLDENNKIKLEMDEYAIDWRVINTSRSTIETTQNVTKSQNMKQLTNRTQQVMYSSIMKNVDLEYIINGNNIKENIILNQYIENFEINFEYSLKNLVLVEEKDQILFINDDGEEIFNFMDLFAFDSIGEITKDVHISITQSSKDVYQIKLSLDESWLKTASYPVVIDPTIVSSTQSISIYDTDVSKDAPNTNYSSLTYMRVSNTLSSNENQGLLYFVLPYQVMDKQITYSTLKLTKSVGSNGRTIGLYKNNTSFTAGSVTWNTKPSTSSSMTDYHIVDTSNLYVFNITKTVREWQATGNSQTTGFTIRDKSYYGAYNSVKSMEATGTTNDPVIEIGYIDPAGIKDYWTYNSQQVGKNSTGYVSDFTGLLNIVRNDLEYSTEKQSLGLSFGYNINDKSSNIGYYKGWNTIYNTRVMFDSYIGRYYSKDYTGNIIYYHPTTCDSRLSPSPYPYAYNCYISEDGSDDIFVHRTAFGHHVGYFILGSDNFQQNFDNDGYLTSTENKGTNQTLTITRNATNKNLVTKVTDSSGNTIENTFMNGNITKSELYVYQSGSVSPHLLEEVLYSYELKTDGSGDYQLTLSFRKNYDATQNMELDFVLKYDYDASGRIKAKYIENRERIEYSYVGSTNKVSSIKSMFSTFDYAEISYQYQLRETIISDHTGNFVSYKFDDFGHTVNILDSMGNAQSFKYLNLFSSEGVTNNEYLFINGAPNYHHNHKLIKQSSPQSNLFNPVSNSGFEYNGINMNVNWRYYDDSGEIRELDRQVQSDREALFGNFSAMINANNIDTGRFKQTIILNEGAYTLTGYVKNESNSNNVWIAVNGHDYGGAVTYVTPNGEWTKVTMTFGINSDNTPLSISLINHSYGRAFFDNIEIYKGFIDNRTNMIDNPSFERADIYGNVQGWLFSNSTYVGRTNISGTLNDLYSSVLGDYAIAINGSGLTTRSATTSISNFLDTTAYQEKGQLVIGAWAKSSGVPTTMTEADFTSGNDRKFRIRVDFVSTVRYVWGQEYDATIIKSEYIDFDSSIEGWQYAFDKVTMPDVDTYWVNVFFEYKGEGSVYFDGLQVFFENSYTDYEYESDYGNLTAIQTSSGDRTEYSYSEAKDYASSPTDILLPDKTVVELSSDSEERTNQVTYNNVASTPTYNDYGQVDNLRVGGTTVYFNTSTTYTHLSQFISTKTNEYGDTTDYYYNTFNGLLEAIENAKNQDTHYIYDNEGKLIKVVSVENHTNYTTGDEDALVEYMYDSKERLWKIILGTNYYYEISYDNQSRMESVSVNNQTLMSYTFEMDGTYYTNRLSEQTYGNGDVIKFNYNDKDQVSSIQFKESGGAFANRFSYEYDQNGRMAVYNTIENGVIQASEYYTYDASGNLIQAVDNEGNIIKYLYDSSGNLTSLYFEIDGDSAATNYTYNECFLYSGDICTQTSSLYDKTSYTSQSNNQITKDYHYETSALYRLQYIYLTGDAFNVKQNFVFSGNTTRINQISYEVNGAGIDYKYTYAYDSLGNITTESYYVGTTPKLYRNYEYDALNQLIVEDSRDYNFAVSTLSDTNFTKFYKYDKRGNITDIKTYLYGQNEYTNPVIPSFYQFSDGCCELAVFYNGSKTYQDIYALELGQSPSLTFNYYDFTNETFVMGLTTNMTYSNLNVNQEGYYYRNYTATDNWDYYIEFRIVFKVGNPVGQLITPQNHVHYSYDATWQDQLTSYGEIDYINGVPQTVVPVQEYTYDAQGNPTNITNFLFEGSIYTYATLEWQGRELSKITVYQQGSYVPVVVISYKYNDQGYRTSKKIDKITQGSQTISYTLDGDKVIYETDGTYAIIYTYDYDGKLIGFSYDPNVNVTSNEEDYFFLRNQLGDITHILNASGTTVVHYVYDAYGNITKTEVTSGYGYIAEINSYTYRGYRYDSETNLYYLNSRYYNPVVGRFINADGMLGQLGDILSTNMYAYCANNPVMYNDFSGYAWNVFEVLGAVALAVAIVSTIIIVVACPLSIPLLVVAGTASASGVAQVFSNVVNDNPLFQNVLGATIGGGIAGLGIFGPRIATSFASGIVNAGINEWENSVRENQSFNYVDFAYEATLYSVLNLMSLPKAKGLSQAIDGIVKSFWVDAFGYTFSDGIAKDFFTDLTSDIIRSTRSNITVPVR